MIKRDIIFCIGPCCENEVYIRELEQHIERLGADQQRLEFMSFHSARVLYASDDEFCWAEYFDRDGEKTHSGKFNDWREAIDNLRGLEPSPTITGQMYQRKRYEDKG